ncbi:hypothetical protein AB0B50_01045 [Streptomyces sp. NPDC041068]|uniref:hypothetical protein n=1 Tax=Streptomyces sp. NPDC041068 TaxID=3155130 RepID=UPI0033FAC0F0
MGSDRRTTRNAGRGGAVIAVQAESAARTNIPVAADRRAARGKYLSLLSTEEPPDEGWFATYAIEAPAAGTYELAAVATAPVELPHTEAVASYIEIAVDGGPPREVGRSQPHWYESEAAWGDLSVLALGDVELHAGGQELTFRVEEKVAVGDALAYALALDCFTLTRVEGTVLRDAYLGDPRTGMGTYRHGEPACLSFRVAGPDDRAAARRVRYAVIDYFGERVADGAVTVPVGRRLASVTLPQLPPGNYRVEADLAEGAGSGAGLTRHFACLPERGAVSGPANRFGVNAFVFSLVPPSRLDAFAAGMKDMGVGCVRDGNAWPTAEPARGAYATEHYDRITRALRRHGLTSLEVVSAAPEWAMTDASLPLPADLRDAYRYARHLAVGRDELATPEALQLSNEPDVDVTRGTGDAHAAYVKAAALGIADAPHPPLAVLPGIAEAGHFQRLMLENDVVRYADVWAFHGYPDPAEQDEPAFPGAADEQHDLARRYGSGVPLWMTESGAFLDALPGSDLDAAQQVVQARYLVRSMVEGLAAGNDRQFWFGGPPIHDEGVYFGLLSREFQPWPAYSACAALASLLGEAHFVSSLEGLPSEAVGHVFATGERDGAGRSVTVTVVWAPEPGRVQLPVQGECLGVRDIMGRRVGAGGGAVAVVSGAVEVAVSRDPVYVVAAGGEEIVRTRTEPPGRRRRERSDAEHIVLSQRYSARNAAPGKDNGDAPPPLGYRLGSRTRMALDVYNFTASERTVTVAADPAEGWSARAEGARRVRVPAMGRTSVEFTLTADKTVKRRVDYRLAFSAELERTEYGGEGEGVGVGEGEGVGVGEGEGEGGDGGGPGSVPPSVAMIQLKPLARRRAEG